MPCSASRLQHDPHMYSGLPNFKVQTLQAHPHPGQGCEWMLQINWGISKDVQSMKHHKPLELNYGVCGQSNLTTSLGAAWIQECGLTWPIWVPCLAQQFLLLAQPSKLWYTWEAQNVKNTLWRKHSTKVYQHVPTTQLLTPSQSVQRSLLQSSELPFVYVQRLPEDSPVLLPLPNWTYQILVAPDLPCKHNGRGHWAGSEGKFPQNTQISI